MNRKLRPLTQVLVNNLKSLKKIKHYMSRWELEERQLRRTQKRRAGGRRPLGRDE